MSKSVRILALIAMGGVVPWAVWAGAGFYLSQELPSSPKNLPQALSAALKVCTDQSCGTGVIVSNEGHFVTAKHVTGMAIPSVAGFGNDADVERVYVSSQSDFAVFKLRIRPDSVLAGMPMVCVPRALYAADEGARAWAIGFASPNVSGLSQTSSRETNADGVRRVIGVGRVGVYRPDAEALQKLGELGRPIVTGQFEGQYLLGSFTNGRGMSGGPVVDRDGLLLGINTAVIFGKLSASLRADFIFEELARFLSRGNAENAFACKTVPAPMRVESGLRALDSPSRSDLNGSSEALLKGAYLLSKTSAWFSEFFGGLAREDYLQRRPLWSAQARAGLHARVLETVKKEFLFAEDTYPGLRVRSFSEVVLTGMRASALQATAISRALSEEQRKNLGARLDSFLQKKLER